MGHVVVTGANRGIGLALCRQMSKRGDSVTAVCRSSNDELTSLGVRVIDGIDVAIAADVASLSETIGDNPVDILINNAGILRSDTLSTVTAESMLEHYRVNTIAPLLVTRALSKNLIKGSKVIIITSRVGSLDDNGSGNNYGYRCSKAAANMVGVNLHHDLSASGVAVGLLHPGLVATDMTGGSGVSTDQSAAGLIERIDELDSSGSGTFRHAEGYALPW